ncbi:uncharacterized protein [Palaemon carinicauda]|uniref:uncharacterized protein n=1 Tax=Palaemon carinicauda TaxID=392227 RepID=UPI0035B5BB47
MDMHSGTCCTVMVDGGLTDTFGVKTGVLHGRILSPLLFIMVIDYVMNKVMHRMSNDIQWKGDQRLCDLEYADDKLLITSTMDEMKEMIDKLVLEGRKVGLVINQRNTEVMQIQSGDQTNCFIGGVILTNSNSFKYL